MKGPIDVDDEITSARRIMINFLEATLNGGALSRLDEQRHDFTCALAEHKPLDGDLETWERISGRVEVMLDERLSLLALDIPEALSGVRASGTLH